MTASAFRYRSGALHCEESSLARIAGQHGTPAYVYSANAIRDRYREYERALDGVSNSICYAVKANSNLAVLRLLADAGAGFDIVSGGELYRVIQAGADPSRVVFSGVGKTGTEIRYALESGIHSFNCESERELEVISRIAAEMNRTASVAIRVNPDVDAATHPYISTGLREHKFGIDIAVAEQLYGRAAKLPGLKVSGVSCHIGSQLLNADPLLEAAQKVLQLIAKLRAQGLPITSIDLGGGLGVPYRPGEQGLAPSQVFARLKERIAAEKLTLFVEPGRSIVAEAGALLTRVILVKRNGSKTFVVVDAAMNDLIRPSLYQAHHEIELVSAPDGRGRKLQEIVGPVCETGDFFARDRELPELREDDLVAIRTAGAYGFVLSSNYNSRPRACELLIDKDRILVARHRESLDDLIRGEAILF